MTADPSDIGLLEREREIEDIARLTERAHAGSGGLALVEGPAGIGKTRILEAARGHAQKREMTVLSGRASELDRDFPFGVVRQLFEPLLATSDAERRAALLQGAARSAAPIVGGSDSPEDAPAAELDVALARFHGLYWLTANLAEQGPSALFVDDLHWADLSSLRFLQFLLPRLEGLPVMVVLASRTAESTHGELLDAIAADSLALVLRPAPLSEAGVRELVASVLGPDPDDRFCEACRAATGGNPFLLRELLRELAADEVTPGSAAAGLVQQLAPPTVARAVLVRLARLGPEATAVARAVAVLGDGSPLRRVAALTELPDDAVAELAVALARADILSGERPPGFAHPILRSAVYGDVDLATRSRLHRGAAELLRAEAAGVDAVAVQLLATEPAGDPAVVETLREAAERAVGRGASATAVACLKRALEEPPTADERGKLVLELASAEVQAGHSNAATEHFAEGFRITGEPRDRAAHAQHQGVALLALGRRDEAYGLLEREVEAAAAVDPDLALLLDADLIAIAIFERPRVPWARRRLERYRGRLLGRTPGERMLMATGAHLDAVYGGGSAAELGDVATQALSSGQLLQDTGGTSAAFFQAIDVVMLADRTSVARSELDRALDEARRRGSAPLFAFASGWHCWLEAREGALAEAEADGRSCAELALPQGWFVAVPLMLGNLLDVLVDRDELDDAARVLEESGMAERPLDADRAFDRAVAARLRLRIARGELAAARADLAALAALLSDVHMNTYPAYLPSPLLAPELAAEDPEAASEQSERALRQARTWDTPRAVGTALHARALADDGGRRLELLEAACTTLESSPGRLEQARALNDFGAALRRANKRRDAREPLRQALDLADTCGARRLGERVRQELRAAGGRPRRSRIWGAAALTASEGRVAAMASEGMSNPEIAQALFVTKKTVEAHLSNAYRKLGIQSRGDLARALKAD